MRLCASCRFWIPPRDTRYAVENPHAGQCTNAKLLVGPERERLYRIGGESAEVYTGALFGCVHHEVP